tara:strand:- start:162 stop:425 length:264 start_codon:yes stop_codon:yes gene_type:complete
MANHKSALKRVRQNIKRNMINRILLSQIRNKTNNFNDILSKKDVESLRKSLSILNSSLSRAVKKGLIKKKYISRKLSLLSNQLNKIV